MSYPFASPVAIPDSVPDRFRERFEQLQTELIDLQRSIRELSETAYSRDGLVSATVGSRGELQDLVLDARIYRTTDAKALATTIAETIWAATQAVTLRLTDLMRPMMPAGQDLDLEAVRGQARPTGAAW
ncbi:MAG: hypothetical protein DLM58_13995 [Pseudonocardiales bacterium]|nr:MAG: hypothetical protein DLM58_13995 [Pseudonocardiales bacterium]